MTTLFFVLSIILIILVCVLYVYSVLNAATPTTITVINKPSKYRLGMIVKYKGTYYFVVDNTDNFHKLRSLQPCFITGTYTYTEAYYNNLTAYELFAPPFTIPYTHPKFKHLAN